MRHNSPMLNKDDQEKLDNLYEQVVALSDTFLGYPCAIDFSYEPLYKFLQYPLNNIGDPFQPSTYRLGTRPFECEVVEFFADLFNAPKNDYWGYVTNGGTEGNLYGLYLARELYPKGIVYFSEETHYSVAKNVHLLGMRHIMVRAQDNGEVDYSDLKESIRVHRDVPAIIIANIGTTMREARDNTLQICAILDDLRITKRYIHSDGAFSGSYAQFIKPKPAFDFTEGADSIAISGHKFVGSPIPCGVVIARKTNVQRIGNSIGYIGCMDTTITGSRNGFSPLVLWYAVRKMGKAGFEARYHKAIEMAEYAVQAMNKNDIPAWRNPGALTVVMPKVNERMQHKWQLATADVSHAIIAPGVDKAHIDALIADLVKEKV